MDSQEELDQIPNIKVCLDELRIFNEDCSEPKIRRVNTQKARLETLKIKNNYKKLQEMQATPKISKISQLLTSPSSTKSSYVSNIKEMSKCHKPPVKKQGKIDYSKCSSLSQFAIGKTELAVLEENEPQGEAKYFKDMYEKGLAYIRFKKDRLAEKKKKQDQETDKKCTFAPDLKVEKNGKNKKDRSAKRTPGYKALSPYVSEIGYTAGCDLASLKEKCTEMQSYLTVKIPANE